VDVAADPRPTAAPLRVRPAPCHELAMPNAKACRD
jgi:hypothetical protein